MIRKFLVFNRYKSVERKEKKTWNLKKEYIPTKTKRWKKWKIWKNLIPRITKQRIKI